mgnify:CR=1 FL=1
MYLPQFLEIVKEIDTVLLHTRESINIECELVDINKKENQKKKEQSTEHL